MAHKAYPETPLMLRGRQLFETFYRTGRNGYYRVKTLFIIVREQDDCWRDTNSMARFISLGGDCQVANQIRKHGYYEKHLFDWVQIPVENIIRLIESDFDRFLCDEDLCPDQSDERLYKVVDTYNKMDFSHDFDAFNEQNIRVVQRRYQYLADKFRSLSTEGVSETPCFIRRWHHVDGPENEEHALQLFRTILSKRPDSKFLYLHNDPSRREMITDRYKSAYLPQISETWEGDHAAWAYLLTEFALR